MDKDRDRDIKLKEMFREIYHVFDWFILGINLGLSVCELKAIECQYSQLNRRKMEILHCWFQKEESPCWDMLAEALMKMDHTSEGKKILNTYCTPIPEDQKPMTQPSPFPSHLRPLISRSGSNSQISKQLGREPSQPYPAQMSSSSQLCPLAYTPTSHLSPDYFRKGEMVNTNIGAPAIDDSSSLISISSRTSSSSSCVSKVFNERRQKQVISNTNPLSFFPFNPQANPQAYLPPCRVKERSQIVPSSAGSQEWIAQRELEHFYFEFQDLLVRMKEMFMNANITGRAIKEYLNDMVCGYAVSTKYEKLKNELSKLSIDPSVSAVCDVLLKFLHYDNICLLKCIINKFGLSSDLVDKYERNFKGFQKWCPLGTLADAHQIIYPPFFHHFSDSSVSLHMDDNWQQHTYSHLEAFKEREINRYVSEDSFHIVHLEKRSIFVVWESSHTVVNELSENCLERFSHLGSQGVLQFFIGRYELDFSHKGKPELYELEPVSNQTIPISISMTSLYSGHSCLTYDSNTTNKSQSNDSGHYSYDDISKESRYSLFKLHDIKTSPTPSRHSIDSSNNSMISTDSQLLQPVDVIRRKIRMPCKFSNPSPSNEHDQIVRPDTPPSVVLIEALKVHLSEDRNTRMEDDIVDEWPKQERKIDKHFLRNMETFSLSKSLRHDLEYLKPDDEIPPTILQRLKNYFRRSRKDTVSTKTSASASSIQERLSLQDSIILDDVQNSQPRFI